MGYKYTKTEIIDDVIRISKLLNKTPSGDEFNLHTNTCKESSVRRMFGTYNNLILEAKLEVYKPTSVTYEIQCLHCTTIFETSDSKRKFCNHTCSALYNNPRKIKKILSITEHKNVYLNQCIVCEKTIVGRSGKSNKYCSRECLHTKNITLRASKVESGLASSRVVKRYLLLKHGNICMSEKCAWNQSILVVNVELEHIDGNSQNNNLSNCILLCPNCHSLTPTYKAKNVGNGRHSRRERYRDGKSW